MANFPSFNAAYQNLLRRVLSEGSLIAPRNIPCRELTFVHWTLDDPRNDRLDFSKTGLPERQEIYDSYAERELDWYVSGNLAASSAPSKFWAKLADSDGNIISNYGHMMMFDKMYGKKSAYNHALETLRLDRDSRQCIMHYNLPRHYFHGNKDVPCTLTCQLLIRAGKLSMWVTQRSCDSIKGLSFDVPWHCYLMRNLAKDMGVELGKFHHSIGSLHVYETDVEKARLIISPRKTA